MTTVMTDNAFLLLHHFGLQMAQGYLHSESEYTRYVEYTRYDECNKRNYAKEYTVHPCMEWLSQKPLVKGKELSLKGCCHHKYHRN